jgi:hypothetical protein
MCSSAVETNRPYSMHDRREIHKRKVNLSMRTTKKAYGGVEITPIFLNLRNIWR